MKIELTKCLECGAVGLHIRGRSWTCKSCGSRYGVYLTAWGKYREAMNARRREMRESLRVLRETFGEQS